METRSASVFGISHSWTISLSGQLLVSKVTLMVLCGRDSACNPAAESTDAPIRCHYSLEISKHLSFTWAQGRAPNCLGWRRPILIQQGICALGHRHLGCGIYASYEKLWHSELSKWLHLGTMLRCLAWWRANLDRIWVQW